LPGSTPARADALALDKLLLSAGARAGGGQLRSALPGPGVVASESSASNRPRPDTGIALAGGHCPSLVAVAHQLAAQTHQHREDTHPDSVRTDSTEQSQQLRRGNDSRPPLRAALGIPCRLGRSLFLPPSPVAHSRPEYVLDCHWDVRGRRGRPAHLGMVSDNTRFGDVRHSCPAICPHRRATGGVRNGGCRSPNGGTPEPAVIHRFARRLLVFKLPNQLALSPSEGAGDVRVLSNSYQLREAGQRSTQCDALLLAAAVLQGHFDVHVTGLPPA
jgi:hypothetical protein